MGVVGMQKKNIDQTFPSKRKAAAAAAGKSKKEKTVDGSQLSVEATQACSDNFDAASQKILHEFDLTLKYGPTLGITRSERWDRAARLGMDPPEEVKSILDTLEGELLEKENCIWEGRV